MKWLYGLLCLIFLILFHEFGHFLAAKLFGVKVESFSVGFGPVLFHKTIKGTDYRLSLLPLGGYCGMKGEDEYRKAIEENLPEIPAEPDSLYGVHPLKRALIGFAGPFFNFILAVIFCSLVNGIGYEYYTYSNKIILANEVIPGASMAAENAGIKSGDKIIKIGKKEITDFSEMYSEISIHPDEDILITVDRNGQILEFMVHSDLDKSTGSGKIGVVSDSKNVIKKHTPHYNFFEAICHGFLDCCNYISVTFKSVKILFKGIDFSNAVSGPARVTEMLGSTVKDGFSAGLKTGFISIFQLMSIISISLFIMNLLPIPVLDGGLILFAIIEAISHKKIKPKTQYYIQFIGIAFIATLFIVAVTSDITYFIHKGINK